MLDAAAKCPSVRLPADDPNVKLRWHPVDAAVSARGVPHLALAVLVVVLWFDPAVCSDLAVCFALAVAVPAVALYFGLVVCFALAAVVLVVALYFDPVVCSDLAVAAPAVALFHLAVVSVCLCLAGLVAVRG